MSDLKRAASLAPSDEAVANALAQAVAAAQAAGISVDDAPEPLPPADEPVEQIFTPRAAAAGGGVINEAAMAQMRQAIRNNPDMMKTMADVRTQTGGLVKRGATAHAHRVFTRGLLSSATPSRPCQT